MQDIKNILRPAYKPHSVRRGFVGLRSKGVPSQLSRLGGHLSRRPTRDSNDASSVSSLLGLAPDGGCLAARIAADAGGLLRRLFTITALRRLSVSVALFRQVAPSRGFPGAVLCGVRTFLDPSPKLGAAIARPT